MAKKIKMLVIPSDRFGVGHWRSKKPHEYIQEHYSDDFDIDIMYPENIPQFDLENFFKKYDLVHIHKQLDNNMKMMSMLKFLDIPVIVDVDDAYTLGDRHPMSVSAKKEKWHVPIVNHLRAADYVSTTTDIYANFLKKHNKNILVFPNAVDPSDKQFKKDKNPNPSGRLRVGIICGSSHLHDIELLRGLPSKVNIDKVQFLLCGFDTRGTKTIYHNDTGRVETRPISPTESTWYEYEKIITDNYKIVSPEHKEFLMQFIAGVDDPFVNEPYRRMWTRDINSYATHYQNVDVLLAPLETNDFNEKKCITADSIISTDKGFYRISDIVDNNLELNIENGDELKKIVNYFKYPNEETLIITTKNGYEIEGTLTHPLLLGEDWVMMKDLKIGDKLDLRIPKFGNSSKLKFGDDFLGEIYGDSLSLKTDTNVSNLILNSHKDSIREFLRAFFTKNASTVFGNIRVNNVGEKLSKDIQFLLLAFGVKCNRYQNGDDKKFNIDIEGKSIVLFLENIGFDNDKMTDDVKTNIAQVSNSVDYTDEIVSIKSSINDVYDIEVEDIHLFNANGFISHNSELKETECAFTHTAFIGQKFGAYTINLTNMLEKGGTINEDATAILIDPARNHKDWAKAINLLTERPDLVKKLQDNLDKFGCEYYDLGKICEKRVEAYKKIVAENREKRHLD